jgi:hypothetical protein
VGRPEVKRPLGRHSNRWEVNITVDLQEVGWGVAGLDLSGTGQGQMVDFCECGNEPLATMKFGEFVDPAEGLLACQEGVCCME